MKDLRARMDADVAQVLKRVKLIKVNSEFDVKQPDVTFEMDAANVVDSFLCVDTSHLYSKFECLSVEDGLQFQNCRVNDCILQVRARHIRGDFGDAAGLLDRCGDARTIPPSAPDDVVVLSVASKLVTGSLFVNAHSEVVTHGSDVRIYPHLALGVEGCFLDLMHSKTMEASLCGDCDWSRASLQFGANNGVHVFDPGAFEPGDSSVGENSSRLRHVHSSCEDVDRSKDASKARNIATIMAFEYEQPSIVLVMGVDVEFQLWNCTVKLVTDEQMSWDVTWLATSNECDVYGTCIPFWGCDIRASTIGSCGRAFELVDKEDKDSGYNWQYATGGTQGEEFIRLLFIKVLDSAHQLASRWVDECRSRFLGNNSCIYVNADYNKIRCMLCNITWIAVRQRFSGVGVDIHIGLVSSTFDTKIKEVYAMISAVETMHWQLQTLLISGDGALDSRGARTHCILDLPTRTRRALMCRRYPLLARTVKNATNGYIVVIIAIDYWTLVVALEMRKINDVDFFLCVNNSKSYSELGYLGIDVELQVPNCKGDDSNVDCRGLQEVQLHANFAKSSLALYVADQHSKEAAAVGLMVHKEVMVTEKENGATRCNQLVNGLGKKLKTMMDDFQGLRARMNEEYKETVGRRYFTVTGQKADEDLIENLISSGESESFMQKDAREIQKESRKWYYYAVLLVIILIIFVTFPLWSNLVMAKLI
ncbi:hypothetical protein SASPL_116974 [Salvia splendens]|uniref:Uncharacterized protein n=1 Tax=Salvia splendens TaxID=180675 RepID=A0A8X8ZX73_SALSN|nr:hypothetical protein SASPL_116974 [Salvia splendens]